MSAIGPCLWCRSAMLPYSVNASEHYLRCSNAFKCDAQGPTRPTPEEAITAWNRLATPDPERVTGRVRWERQPSLDAAFDVRLGNVHIGTAFPDDSGWTIFVSFAGISTIKRATEASARAALVAAVMEAIGDE